MLCLHICGLCMLFCQFDYKPPVFRGLCISVCVQTWESVSPGQLAVSNSSCTTVSLSQTRPTSLPSGEPAKIIWRILFWRHISHRPKATETLILWCEAHWSLDFQKFPRFLFVKHFYWDTDHVPDMYCQLVLSVEAASPRELLLLRHGSSESN